MFYEKKILIQGRLWLISDIYNWQIVLGKGKKTAVFEMSIKEILNDAKYRLNNNTIGKSKTLSM